ncbi:MAG: nuclear transport factor 2 family protein [Bacteroidota bacterium]
MSYLEKAKDLYRMIGEGNMLDAFEKYYHEDVVMVEATGEAREGKDTNRKFEIEWLNSLQEMHGGGTTAITSDEGAGVTIVEAWIDCTFKNGNRMKMEQVCVQRWEDDQIIRERFYYNVPGQ